QMAASPQKYRYIRSLLALPNYSRATQIAVRAETERQMTVAAIALQRYELVHGRTAASLEALVPEFLQSVPRDYMSGLPLRSKPEGESQFLLYSGGEDGRDDGGDPTPVAGGKPGLWECRDAVWPWAQTNGERVVPRSQRP